MHGHLFKWSIIILIVSKSAEVCQGDQFRYDSHKYYYC